MDLEGRVALVTGAARRIGRAIALRLARAGCHVVVHYRRAAKAAAETAAACRAAGVRAEPLAADFAEPAAPAALVRTVLDRLGRLDVLVNNAAEFEPMDFDRFDPAVWERTLRVNLTAPAALIHAARPALREARGRVVNLCDAATARPWPDYLAYAVSKGGLETLTRVAARALAPEVNVVGIAVGVGAWPEDYNLELRRRLEDKIPLGRAGTEQEIAAAVHFVLRDGDYITGAILPVDGGRSIV